MKDCIIIGGGLSGLYAAWKLEQAGVDYRLLEARTRLGGRIDCEIRELPGGGVARFDLGPAWVWPQLQPLMAGLAAALDVRLFPQQVAGGGLVERGDRVQVECAEPRLGAQVLEASRVILALPPRLAAQRLRFDPVLPPAHLAELEATPTWMAAHAKWLAFYERPFWREQGLSGEVFSRIGPLTEIYDASPAEGGPYALFGFFGLPAGTRRQLGEHVLAEHCLAPLGRLFGEAATDPTDWRIKDWSADPLTATADDLVPPAGHPAYGLDAGRRVTWSGKLIFSGTETAAGSGGYLEGALEAARDAVASLLDSGART